MRPRHLPLALGLSFVIGCSGAEGENDVPQGDASTDTGATNDTAGEGASESSSDVPSDGPAEASDGAPACPGLGTYRGSRFGMDPTQL